MIAVVSDRKGEGNIVWAGQGKVEVKGRQGELKDFLIRFVKEERDNFTKSPKTNTKTQETFPMALREALNALCEEKDLSLMLI